MISIQRISFAVILALLSITSIYSQKKIPTSEVNYVSENDGTITMRAIGTGSNELNAISLAEQNAVNVLLFRGLPESKQKGALLSSNEADEKDKHKQYFENFYNKKRYKTFIMSSIPVTNFAKQKGGIKSITVDVKINLFALQKDLEQNNLIRKFGF